MRDDEKWNGPGIPELRAGVAIEVFMKAMVAADALREAGIDRISFDLVLSRSIALEVRMEIRIARLIATVSFTQMEMQLATDANAIIEHKFRSLVTKATP